MHLVIFEDKKYEQLYPIALTRAVFELKCGVTSLADKIIKTYPSDNLSLFVREYIAPVVKKRFPKAVINDIKSITGDDILMVNGRILFTSKSEKFSNKEGWAQDNEDFIYARINKGSLGGFSGESLEELIDYVKLKVKEGKVDCKIIDYPWELIDNNPEALVDDFKLMGKSGIEGDMAEGAVIYGPKDRVYIAKGAEVHPLVCIDTKGGPVFIDEGAAVHPFTRIEGPSYIGPDTIIMGAKIREGCTIGPVCRIAGELEESIIHGYSNKAHDGFSGHAYVGEWVNLGALTTNSDLKNDYGNVSVVVKGKPFDTGSTKVGAFIGDHTKTSIGTYFNTGTSVGALCVLIGSGGVLPKYIPSGSWFMNNAICKGFGFKKTIETSSKVMARRKVEFTREDAEMLKKVYEISKPDRDVLIKKARYGQKLI
jgi:UDP-N-acetylglucosamine diphosphorylase/glucosamine-1-phosphate N-acetyltransferase